jgi:hypothetical protein
MSRRRFRKGVGSAIGVGALCALAVAASPAKADYRDCGERTVAPNTTKHLKAQKMTCDGARDLAADYEQKTFSGNSFPEIGEVTNVRRFRCRFYEYFDPFELAYKCRHTRQRGKAMKAFHPPEREPSFRAPSKRGKACGSFRLEGVLTPVKVRIRRGDFPCHIARRVMKDLYHGRDTGRWRCIGPQTGYARCEKSNRGVVIGRF